MLAMHSPKQHSAALSHGRPLGVQHLPTFLLRFWNVSQQRLHKLLGLVPLVPLSRHLLPEGLH